jgi:hypothetical protein
MNERVYMSFDRFEDSEALRDAMNGFKYKSFIDQFDQEVFRRIIKYNDVAGFDVSSLSPSEADPYKIELLISFAESFRSLYWKMYDEVVRNEC